MKKVYEVFRGSSWFFFLCLFLLISSAASGQFYKRGLIPVKIPSGGFAVDGDAYANTCPDDATTPNNFGDWFPHAGPAGSVFTSLGEVDYVSNPELTDMIAHYTDNFKSGDLNVFGTSNKISDNPESYLVKAGNIPPKDDMQHATAYFTFADPGLTGGSRNEDGSLTLFPAVDGDLWCVFAADRWQVNGDSYIDFEFNQAVMQLNNDGTFTSYAPDNDANHDPTGGRTPGDILVTIYFQGGGKKATLYIDKWENQGPGTPYGWVNSVIDVDLPPHSVFCTNNLGECPAPWPIYDQPAPYVYAINQYAEGAINLSLVMDKGRCGHISTIWVRTKSSASPSAELKDLAGPPFNIDLPYQGPVAECPDPVSFPPCSQLEGAGGVREAYENWRDGFIWSGGTGVVTPTFEPPLTDLPVDVICSGISLSVVYTVMDECERSSSCTATFKVDAPAPLVVNCPLTPVNFPACTPMADIQAAYAAWAAGFTHSGDCNVTDNLSVLPPLPADVYCKGADLSFTFIVKGDCGSAECTSTFKVAAPAPLVVNCPLTPVDLTACTPMADIQAAYTAWAAGFTRNGDCNVTDNLGDLPPLPADVYCKGADLSFTFVVTGDCGSAECTSTFKVAAPTPLVVNCPLTPVNLPACTPLADIQAAYTAWAAGFTRSGDCNVTDNLAALPLLPADVYCKGADLSFTFGVTGDCGSAECTSTFKVAAPAPLVVNCPLTPVNLPACTPLAQIQAAYDGWAAGFTRSGDCNVTDNLSALPPLPADVYCKGADLSFTFVVSGDCGSAECTSTFKVAAPTPLVVNCPLTPVNLPACTPMADIQAAYTAWAAGFTRSGDCNVTDNLGDLPPLPADVYCKGADLSFTFVVTGDCGSANCTSTFKVAAPAPLVVNCPLTPVNLPACTPLADIQTAYAAWAAGFTRSGDCNVTDNLAALPLLPADVYCKGADLSFTFVVTGDCGSAECTSTFKVAAPALLVVNCPLVPVDLPACTPLAQIQAAYDGWAAGFTRSGDCNVTNNLDDLPPLPADVYCKGADLSFTFVVTGDCESANCTSTFKVAAPIPFTMSCPGDVVLPSCSSAEIIMKAYDTWRAGFASTGDCILKDNMAGFPDLPDLTCGGKIDFTYVAEGDCASGSCYSSFTVKVPEPLIIQCPDPVILPACSTLNIAAEYNQWKAGFSASGDCNLTDNMGQFPPLVTGADGSVNLSFTYVVTGTCGSGTCKSTFALPPCPCGTAFATLGNSNSHCFFEYVERTNNNWGWTNYISTGGTYLMPVYTGVSDCIPGPEDLVGNATVIYNSTAKQVTVKIEMLAGYVMSVVHIYVGTTPLPVVKGKYTVAPGQYTWNSGDLVPRAGTLEITLEARKAPFYIIIHAVTCKGVEQLASLPETDLLASQILKSGEINVYPNPFSDKVTFEFTSARDGRAVLEIHNLLGQKVQTLLDRQVREGVLNRTEFRPVNQVPGIYLYRLLLGDAIQSGRIVYNRDR